MIGRRAGVLGATLRDEDWLDAAALTRKEMHLDAVLERLRARPPGAQVVERRRQRVVRLIEEFLDPSFGSYGRGLMAWPPRTPADLESLERTVRSVDSLTARAIETEDSLHLSAEASELLEALRTDLAARLPLTWLAAVERRDLPVRIQQAGTAAALQGILDELTMLRAELGARAEAYSTSTRPSGERPGAQSSGGQLETEWWGSCEEVLGSGSAALRRHTRQIRESPPLSGPEGAA